MSPQTLRILVPVVIIIHAIGHLQGVVVALNLFSTETWHSQSWLLARLLGETPTRIVSLVIWIVAFIGFALVGLGAFGWELL